jgi:N-acetylglucosamine-6-sulfatase
LFLIFVSKNIQFLVFIPFIVPFYVRGPNVSAGVSLPRTMVNNVDIGPTILEIAGVKPSRLLDGRSFASQLSEQGRIQYPWTRDRLVHEYYGLGYTERGPCNNGSTACPGGVESLEDAPSNTWSGLRILNATHNILYAEYRPLANSTIASNLTNFTLGFDMNKDPWQLDNAILTWPSEFTAALSKELWDVALCRGVNECP